jgi:hypothetical protein
MSVVRFEGGELEKELIPPVAIKATAAFLALVLVLAAVARLTGVGALEDVADRTPWWSGRWRSWPPPAMVRWSSGTGTRANSFGSWLPAREDSSAGPCVPSTASGSGPAEIPRLPGVSPAGPTEP